MGFGSFFHDLWEWFSWVYSVWLWLIRPTVIPWAGAIAAIIAALTLEPKKWLKSPTKSVGRAFRVAAVWLIIAWMLSSVARFGSGRGSGEGKGIGSGTGTSEGVPPPVRIVPGEFPHGTPERVHLVVNFVASAGNPTVAQEFSCELIQRGTGKKIEIRATDMHEFDKLLVQQLSDLSFPQAATQPTILIKRSPFPGENVLRRLQNKLRAVLPNANVVFDE